MRGPSMEWKMLSASFVAELARGGNSVHVAARPANRPSRKKLAFAEQDSHIDGLEVSESTWGDWDQAYEECAAQTLLDQSLVEAWRRAL